MSFTSRSVARAWLLIPLAAVGFLAWAAHGRMQHVNAVTNTDSEEMVVDAASPTGYASGQRWLIVPERNNHSYQWIAQTQQMLARHEWRVRRIDTENAPYGREVHSASPYRWWLGFVAWCDHAASGRPLGLSVEKAGLYADPALQILVLLGTTIFLFYRCGIFPAALFAVGWALLFPLAGSFLPGVPDQSSLTLTCALWSVLPLLGSGENPALPRPRRDFIAAGVAGGLGLWISAADQMPIVLGIALGVMLLVIINPRRAAETPAFHPWRVWALTGAITGLGAYLIEYFPYAMDMRLEVNHPLYGIGWLGVGELLTWLARWRQQGKLPRTRGDLVSIGFALAAIATVPVALVWTKTKLFQTEDLLASRLTNLPYGVVAKNLAAWIARDGVSGAVAATCLSCLWLVPAAWLLLRRATAPGVRASLALAIGPVIVALVFAGSQLRWWNIAGALSLALLAAATTASVRRAAIGWAALAGCTFVAGLLQLVPSARNTGADNFTRSEVEALLERGLAHWISNHAGPDGAVILVPPDRTPGLCFHGGLRGIGTANWENRDGLAATVRIATATTAGEAQALLGQRGVTHLVLPSWDTDLDEFARWSLPNPEDAFIMALHHWALPPWLRPVPYPLPNVAGFEGQSVVVLAVTDDGNRAAGLARLAEYFLEMRQTDLAATTVSALQRFPSDLNALVALAQVEKATGDEAGLTKALNALLASVAGGFDRALSWDRRVSLAVALAEGDHADLAREQVRRCITTIDEARIRSLTTGSLYRLQVLGKAYGLPIADPPQQALALKLLPVELRSRLQP